MTEVFLILIQTLLIVVLTLGASLLVNSGKEIRALDLFFGVLACTSVFYYTYLLSESKHISGIITIVFGLAGYIRNYLLKRNSTSSFFKLLGSSLSKSEFFAIFVIVLYVFFEVSTRKLIAGDALAVYYLKAKAIYYGIPIVDMPTASYSIFPSVMWFLFSSYVGIEAGAEYSRYWFSLVSVIGVYGLLRLSITDRPAYLLIFSMLFAYTSFRVHGHYPITMGYFDWLVGCMLGCLVYILFYDDRNFIDKTLPILLLSSIGLVKLEGIVYANIVFFIYLLKIKDSHDDLGRIFLTIALFNCASLSYLMYIKFVVGVFDYQVFKINESRSIFDVLWLLLVEAKNFWREALFIGLIYVISLFKVGRVPASQLLFFIFIYSFYVLTYYTTAVDVAWHVVTSFQRLMYQTIPSLLLFTAINFNKSEKIK